MEDRGSHISSPLYPHSQFFAVESRGRPAWIFGTEVAERLAKIEAEGRGDRATHAARHSNDGAEVRAPTTGRVCSSGAWFRPTRRSSTGTKGHVSAPSGAGVPLPVANSVSRRQSTCVLNTRCRLTVCQSVSDGGRVGRPHGSSGRGSAGSVPSGLPCGPPQRAAPRSSRRPFGSLLLQTAADDLGKDDCVIVVPISR
jgi:hypothetical protein